MSDDAAVQARPSGTGKCARGVRVGRVPSAPHKLGLDAGLIGLPTDHQNHHMVGSLRSGFDPHTDLVAVMSSESAARERRLQGYL